MAKLICPSMMCADFSNLAKEVRELDAAGIDIYHMDIMDGRFVPNYGMGLQDFTYIKSATNKLVDVHLMITDPGDYVEMFADLGADIIYFHPEADLHPTRTIQKIRDKEKSVGIAINPGTSVATIVELLPLVDYIMVMTVNPGFSGQKYLDYVDKKILELIELKTLNTYKIIVDGAVSKEKINALGSLGVDGFVLGTSAIFKQTLTYKETMQEIREM